MGRRHSMEMRFNFSVHTKFDHIHTTFSREPNGLEATIASHEPLEPPSLACCGVVETKLPLEALGLILSIGALMIIVSGAAAIQQRISRNLLRHLCW